MKYIVYCFSLLVLFSFSKSYAQDSRFYNVNLINNGDAETVQDGSTISGWETTQTADGNSEILVDQFGFKNGDFSRDGYMPKDAGSYYFRAPFGAGTTHRSAFQTVDLSEIKDMIDANNVECNIGGMFGGWSTSSGQLIVHYMDINDKEIGSLKTDDVTEVDKAKDYNRLVQKSNIGNVPRGTSKLKIELRLTKFDDSGNGSVAYADNLRCVLIKKSVGK